MRNYSRWQAEELSKEIAALGEKIADVSKFTDKKSRHAVSYMRQLLKEKQDRLALLKIQEAV